MRSASRGLRLQAGRTPFAPLGLALIFAAGLAPPGDPARFEAQVVDGQIGIGYAVAVADMNADRKPDILLVNESQVRWYENPAWRKNVIVDGATPRDNVCIAAADRDGDGISELALGARWNPSDTEKSGSLHWLARQDDPRTRWKVVDLPAEPTVHRIRWADVDGDGRRELVVAPLHGRGNRPPDFAGAGARLMVCFPPERPETEPWKCEVADESMHQTHNFWVQDQNGDGRDEILLAGREGVVQLDRTADGWKRMHFTDTAGVRALTRPAGEVKSGTDSRGRPFVATVEPMHGNTLAVYSGADWKREVLTDQLGEGHALWCANLDDRDGDEIVIGWRSPSRDTGRVGVAVYSRGAEGWKRTLIDDNEMACEDIAAADLNGDGRLDLVASGRATHNLKIYWNRR